MGEDLKQFVPSEICLRCDGCCRFRDEKSVWRPKMSKEEIPASSDQENKDSSARFIMDDDGYVKTVPNKDTRVCQFFAPKTNTCHIYEKRPLECRLYPFMLISDQKHMVMAVHTRCPFIQEKEKTQELQAYVDDLKEFCLRKETIEFLERNPSLAGDYQEDKTEIRHLFKIL
ncbi:MAG: YkgJ family cysteine cluster protein [Candidatus Omnitrophota bacterium]